MSTPRTNYFLIIMCLALLTPITKAKDIGKDKSKVSLIVLGVAQDAGYPQLNCYKPHCMRGWQDHSERGLATSIAIIDHSSQQKFVFEATPDIRQQFYDLNSFASDKDYPLNGIFLTHGHIGHYTGLMHLGHEAAGTKAVPVYVMPRMAEYLTNNGPWSQLVELNNISLKPLSNNLLVQVNKELKVIPLIVPHRDEYTETVGFKIVGPNKTVLFIPDIDKWHKWSVDIFQLIEEVDVALLDGSFYSNGELPNRDMSEIPHPFVEESIKKFSKLSTENKKKIFFIHFNHSNPLLIKDSFAQKVVRAAGFNIAHKGMTISL